MKNASIRWMLAAMATAAAISFAHDAFAASTFSIARSGGNFVVSRSGPGTNAAETVYYRTVSRSGLAGVHFANAEGSINFTARQLSKTVPVEEFSASQFSGSNKLFLYYQSGVASAKDRTYRFEVVDEGGFPVAAMDRTISGDSSYSISTSAFNEKSVSVIGSDAVTVTDAGYAQAYHAIPLDTYFSGLPREYLSLSGARLNMVIDMQVLEDYDGYQYIQILANQTNHCDTGAKKGNPGTIGYSRYMAGFSHLDGEKLYQFKKYTFPLVTAGNNCGKVDNAWNDAAHDYNDAGILWQQYFNFNVDQKARADDGRLSVPASVSTLGIRFDASGDDRDDWRARNVTAKIQAAAAAPELLGNPVISAAPSCKGSTLTVSLAFNEIVVVITGDTTLRTTWGDLAYVAGSGSNVLTFSGTITASAGTQLEIGGLTGTVRGLSSTTFTWPRTYTTSRTVKAMPTPPREGNVYLLSWPMHLRWFADNLPANATLSAALASDIDLVNADGFSPIGGNVGFNGVFDGRGHSISRLSISSPDSSGRTGFFGLVGAQGVVTNLVLSDVNISCASPTARIGAVCGQNLGTIVRCSVSGSVATSSSMNGNGSALGGVCGENGGTVRACRAVSGSSSYLLINRWSNISVGGVAGVNSAAGRLECCYFHARYNEYNYNGITRGAVCGANAGTVRDCVGLHDNNNWFNGCFGSNTGTTNNVPFPLDAAFSGGEACYTLNDGVTDGSQPWYQTIGEDDLPQFSGETVYRHGSVYNNTDHIWSFAEFEHSADFSNGVWSVVCTSGGETTTLSATGTCAVTTQPTCTSPGETTWTYIPPANDYGVTATNAVQSGVPAALGHVWGEASYFWAADGSTATASNACTVCGAPLVETVEAVCVVTREPTQTVPGEKSCTATFSSPCFTEQTTVVAIPVLPPPVPYIDADGVERTCPYYTIITNAAGNTAYGTADEEAWYVVTNDVSIGGRLRFLGSTNHLIVCDGATLAVTNTSGDAIHATYGCLSIYAQAGGTGTLDLNGYDDAIEANNITINGGVVNANGGCGLYPGDSVTINGGVVNVNGSYWAGIYGNCDVILGWRTLTDSITINSVKDSADVYVKPGQMLTDGTTIYTGGPLDQDAIAGKTLRPYVGTPVPYIDTNGYDRWCPYYTVITNAGGDAVYGTADEEAWYVVTNDVSIGGMLRFNGSANHLIVCDGATLAVTNKTDDAIQSVGSISIHGQSSGTGTLDLMGADDAIQASDVTINGGVVNANGTCNGIVASGSVILGWSSLANSITVSSLAAGGGVYVMPGQTLADEDGNTYTGGPLDIAQIAAIAGKTLRPHVLLIPYIDADGVERLRIYYTIITNAEGGATYGTYGEEAWYVVTNDVSIGGTLRFNGSANHLIVCDGATLDVTNNRGGDAIQAAGSISIYGQSGGTGTLDLKGSDDTIEADSITINGGVVNVNGPYGLYPGYDGDITVNGGVVDINAYRSGIWIEGNVTVSLGWRTLTDSITISSFSRSSVFVKPGKMLTDGTNLYTGGPIDKDAIAGKTLRPYISNPPFPSYLDGADDQVKTNYLSWAMRNGYDVNSEHEAEFLLNIAPGADSAELRIDGIEPGDGGAIICVVAAARRAGSAEAGDSIDLSQINGVLSLSAGDSPGALVPKAIPAANITYDAGAAMIFVPSSFGSFIRVQIIDSTPSTP